MTIETLHTRIAQLDAQIGLQEQLLQNLKNDRILARRELNAALDPIARLPLEISSEIFLQVLPSRDRFAEVRANAMPMLFLSICNSWTRIALATPELWCTLKISFPCAKGLPNVLSSWLERARSRPLSILLHCHGMLDCDVAKVIWAHGEQLKQLEIIIDPIADAEEEDCEDSVSEASKEGRIKLWDHSSYPDSLPALEKLSISSRPLQTMYDPESVPLLFYPHFAHLLLVSFNLVECQLEYLETSYRPPHTLDLNLPKLRRLMFGEEHANSDDAVLLDLHSLPSLETLSVSCREISTDALVSFFRRCSPPLRELVLGHTDGFEGPGKLSTFDDVADCLAAVPDLRHLELWWASYQMATHLLRELGESSASLVPHLSTLILHLESQAARDMTQLFWSRLYMALLFRRTQFRVVRVHIYYGMYEPPSADTVAALRELADNGMQIYITGVLDTEPKA
ncbi:hypothetical protein R3P38DRAFT_2899512 [Favolaschia claudopus]|uniref:F-box domain-containing protein n=1 Tax=Favolaschia claudopus TaxID=2862362 RepID=A0AAW0CLP4_9AGAR